MVGCLPNTHGFDPQPLKHNKTQHSMVGIKSGPKGSCVEGLTGS